MNSQPANRNYLSQLGFKFVVNRLPTVNYFCQTATIPAISMIPVNQPTPLANIPKPGDKLYFEPLTVKFKVDEDLANYREMVNWMFALGHPISSEQLRSFSAASAGGNPKNIGKTNTLISDATLLILTSHKNPNYNVVYRDMFPTGLSELTFDSTDIQVNYLEATATFHYLRYEIQITS